MKRIKSISITLLSSVSIIIFGSSCCRQSEANETVAGNPISELAGQPIADPHMISHDGRVYLFASHDYSFQSKGFDMRDWWVWSSDDLVHWKQESVLKPEDTFMKEPSTMCWATFGVPMGEGWRLYFSAGPTQIGVAAAQTPAGPWTDPLGKPLIAEGEYATDTRDPDILLDDDGSAYIVFGTFNYFIARLSKDGLSLDEKARPVVIMNPFGPYGKDITDDKPSLHKHGGLYYLSWCGFYAVSENVYGPYEYRGTVLSPESVAPDFSPERACLLIDRHGNFFEFNGQWYYAANDFSQPGRSPFYRDAVMGYVHYKDNGDIAPVRIDRTGVGQYDAKGEIEAEDWFKSEGVSNTENPWGGFDLKLDSGGRASYPNIHNVPADACLSLSISNSQEGGVLEFRDGAPDGPVLGTLELEESTNAGQHRTHRVTLSNHPGTLNLWIVAKGNGDDPETCRIDSFHFES